MLYEPGTYPRLGERLKDWRAAACFRCGTVTSGDITAEKDYCQKCGEELTFYRMNESLSDAQKEFWSDKIEVLTDIPARLDDGGPIGSKVRASQSEGHPVRYLCPRCGKKELTFEAVGFWD